MGMTDLEFKKARRTITGERDDKLWLGDVFGRIQSAEMREEAKRLGKSLRSAQEYAQTARMCTPPVRERVCATRVLVSYSVLRVGARANQFTVPDDEGYRTLLRMIEDAEASRVGQIGLTDYRIAVGLGPKVEDLFGPDGSDEEFRALLQETAPGPDRDRLYRDLVAQQREKAALHSAVAHVVAAENAAKRGRQNENERLGLHRDPALTEETAFARQVCAIAESIKHVMQRFGHLDPASLADERNQNAVDLAQSRIGVFDGWLAGTIASVGETITAIPAQRGTRRTPAAA